MKKLITSLFIISLTGLVACKKNSTNTTDNTVTPTGNKIAPDGFNFSTAKTVTLNLTLKATNGDPLSGVVVSVYNPANTSADASIFKGVTNSNGILSAQISVPASLTQIIIDPSYLGLLRSAKANINGNAVTATIGGATGYSGDIVPETITVASGSTSDVSLLSTGTSIVFAYPSPYTSTDDAVLNTTQFPLSYGVPKYLETTSDVISASLLKYVNASLPESKPLPTTHPDYIANTAVSTLNVIAKSDVWITFVAEGAGNLNSLAFYTYTTGNPPATEADIKNATLVFPNASGLGSGGGLSAGNKVKIGTFNAGTSIGFILIGNGWTGKGVNVNATKFYSDSKLNPETDATLQRHTAVLYDDVHQLTLIGFEDLNRQSSSCDNDFNDIVFYATSNPVTGISNTGVAPVDKASDTDGDGVIDALDAFPNDATKAYISYFPSQTGYATLAFEDNWPLKGDYDMNDLVVNYRYTFVTNAQNQVVTIQGDYNVAAAGASYKNGFGVQLPIAASAVKSVTGQQFLDNYITLASNGVEAGQSKAVIIPFDNSNKLISNPGNAYFVNTLNTLSKVQGTTATVLITLTSPIAQTTLTASSLNPFLISNERRGYEIHLPGYAPTDKADTKLFGTNDDTSVPASGKYYISKDNWPWAMSFNGSFVYPLETVKITDAYPHFTDWASSAGSNFTDWYSNTASGYRTTSNLYLK
ncbi:LruC domain-containing protein [Mucilaginibacter paludis]|nr:LruC domain-containing protein [Mucilaginibacter paludis]